MSLKTRLQKIEEAFNRKQSSSYWKDTVDYKIKEFEEKMICIYELSDGSKKNVLNLIKKKHLKITGGLKSIMMYL